jgi:hypothetical protein
MLLKTCILTAITAIVMGLIVIHCVYYYYSRDPREYFSLLDDITAFTQDLSKKREKIDSDNVVHGALADQEETVLGNEHQTIPMIPQEDVTTDEYSAIQTNLKPFESSYNAIFTNLHLGNQTSTSTKPLSNMMGNS